MKANQKQALIQQHGSDVIVDALKPYITNARDARIEEVIAGRLQGIQLAIEAPADINNALAAVRTSEALGVAKVHLICPEGEAKYARSITQGAIYWVEVVFYSSLEGFLRYVKQQGLRLAGGTPRASCSLAEVPIDKPLCMMIGNEQRGLSVPAQQACEIEYKIPMYGMTESFNLSVSAALSLYDTTERKRQALGGLSDLNSKEQLDLRAGYYLNSVAPRLAVALLSQGDR